MSGNTLAYLFFIVGIFYQTDVLSQTPPCTFCGDCPLPTRAANPGLDADCGDIKIAFVLDESSSVENYESDVRAGVLAFLQALDCTGAEINFVEFSTEARRTSVTGSGYRQVNNALISDVRDYFDGGGVAELSSSYAPEGWTNWEAALEVVEDLSGDPDLIIGFTDGNPTAFNGIGGLFGGDEVEYCEVESNATTSLANAMVVANRIKTSSGSPHVFMLGVGTDISAANLQQISGSVRYQPGTNRLASSDWYIEQSYSQLANCLRSFAQDLCPLCPTLNDVSFACDSVPNNLFRAVGGTRRSNCGTISVNDNFSHPGACGGSQTVTFTLTDNNGTVETSDDIVEECSANVTVRAAKEAPPLQCSSLQPLSCDQVASTDPSDFAPLISSNGLSGNCQVVLTGTPSAINTMNVGCGGGGFIMITYTVTDNCSRSYPDFQCMQTILEADVPDQPACNELPPISCAQAEDAMPEDYDDITSSSGTGICQVIKTGVATSIDKSGLSCNGSGTIMVVYEVTDNCGNSYPNVSCQQSV
ncbi:MAG: VWA domain-containing protein, partial [Saprospiraceae bacterium]|nr:VWA domain-containing protein [Saprospiraceae bacterium]